jgi:hypothetical protein
MLMMASPLRLCVPVEFISRALAQAGTKQGAAK